MNASQPRALRREVGLFGATVSGTGVIIGAGVYALIGSGAELAGNAVWMSFLLAAVVAGLSAATYSRMGRRVPKDAPEFQYAGLGLGFRAGFLAGWLMLWADVVAAATVALAFGGYFSALTGSPLLVPAILLVVVLTAVASLGISHSVLIIAVLTAAEVIGLLIVTVIGIPSWGDYSLLQTKDGFQGVWTASSLIFFAFIGFDELGNLAEEMRRPERDLPRAIVLAMVLSTTLYVLVAISAVSLLGAEAIGASSSPLADAVERVFGTAGGSLLSILALASTGNTVLLLLISGARSIYGMARSGALPAVLGRVSARNTPTVATCVILGCILAFVALGDIAVVARIATFASLLSFTLVNLSLVRVLKLESGSWRTALAHPLSVAQPVLAAAACTWLAIDVGWTAMAAGAFLSVAGWTIGTVVQKRATSIV